MKLLQSGSSTSKQGYRQARFDRKASLKSFHCELRHVWNDESSGHEHVVLRKYLWAESYESRVMSRWLWAEGCEPWAVSHGLWADGCEQRAVSKELWVECYEDRVWSGEWWRLWWFTRRSRLIRKVQGLKQPFAVLSHLSVFSIPQFATEELRLRRMSKKKKSNVSYLMPLDRT